MEITWKKKKREREREIAKRARARRDDAWIFAACNYNAQGAGEEIVPWSHLSFLWCHGKRWKTQTDKEERYKNAWHRIWNALTGAKKFMKLEFLSMCNGAASHSMSYYLINCFMLNGTERNEHENPYAPSVTTVSAQSHCTFLRAFAKVTKNKKRDNSTLDMTRQFVSPATACKINLCSLLL